MKEYIKFKREKYIFIMLICMTIVFSIGISISRNFAGDKNTLIDSNQIEINNGWQISDGDKTNTQSLPINFKYSENKTFKLTKSIVDYSNNTKSTMCILTTFSDFDVKLDGQTIYTFNDSRYEQHKNVAKRRIHVINLPSDYNFKEITLQMTIKGNKYSNYILNDVYIGSKGAIFNRLVESESFNIIGITLSFILGISLNIMGIIASIKKASKVNELFYIGIFAIMSGMYALSEGSVLLALTNNTYLINIIAFTMLLLIPIPILFIIIENTKRKYRKPLYVILFIMIIDYFIQSILTFLQVCDYERMINITHGTIAIGMLVVIYVCIKSWSESNKKGKYFVLSIFPISVGAITDMILYRSGLARYNGLFFQVGLLIFLMIQTVIIVDKYFSYYSLSVKSTMYEKMAFTDMMTSIGNRAAFEEKITRIDKELKNSSNNFNLVWCFEFDINNLKEVNDNIGHQNGDKLIIDLAELIDKIFGSCGDCYRTGGDEFVVITCNVPQEIIESKVKDFYDKLEESNRYKEVKLSVAIGYDKFNYETQQSILEVISKVDSLMYENKRKMKAEY